MKQIRDNISIALRKGSSGEEKKTVATKKYHENTKKILNQNEGFSFLQSIRGSTHIGARHFMIYLPWLDSLIFRHFLYF